VAIAYMHPETGEEIVSFPADLDLLGRVKIVYHEMPGWNTSTTGVRRYDDLPSNAKSYVECKEISSSPSPPTAGQNIPPFTLG
jgi:adenylosuccinate synthase